jgi:hypothetical protein
MALQSLSASAGVVFSVPTFCRAILKLSERRQRQLYRKRRLGLERRHVLRPVFDDINADIRVE